MTLWRRRIARAATLLASALLTTAGDCGAGDGSGGKAPVIVVDGLECDGGSGLTLSGAFPSGFDLLPDGNGVVVQLAPPAVLGLDLSQSPPALLASDPIPPLFPNGDSDGDGVSDGVASSAAGFGFRTPLPGSVTAVDDDLVLLSASNYEELIFVDPRSGELVEFRVETPASFAPGAYPFLPAPGTSALRTALSTRACIEPAVAFDSLGDPIGADSRCPPPASGASLATALTSGTAVSQGRIYAPMVNLLSSAQGRFAPGVVLVYELDLSQSPILARPDATTPVIFTTGFNPTRATAHTTPGGRSLVLVTVTGAIGAGTGAGNLLTDAAVDVIDTASRRVVATIPLGRAGPSFDAVAIDPSGRLALLGSSSQNVLFGVDLASLDDPALYSGAAGDPPIVLDGSNPDFPDARVFTADTPLALPELPEGPDPASCAGFTHVAIDGLGLRAHATDFCDGTLTTLLLDLAGAPVPLPPDRISVLGRRTPFAPNVPSSLTQLRAPGVIRIRPGEPGVDFLGPDGFVVAGLPEGTVCAFRL